MDIKIPPPLDLSYQTVSMLSTTGQTPRFSTEKGKTRLDFGQGPGNIVFKLDGKAIQQKFGIKAMADCRTAECLANDPEYKNLLKSEALSKFKLATGTLQVGDTKLDLKVTAYTLADDLSYALELVGMAENTRIRLDGVAYDRDGKVQGTISYGQVVSQKPDVVTLERLLGEIQTGINAGAK